ncbi:MAG: hypothetical protein E6G67_01035 [Actinobacteria bacterium]|nr:MAG: hypothetical protein E6G67_01035 [Actinomycetota bacterium]
MALAAAGGERLGLSRRRSVYLGTFIAIAIFLTGSREATAGLVLAAVVVAHVRFRRPIMPMAAAALAAAALSAPFWAPTGGGAPGSPSALTARWAQIFHPSTWSTSTSNTSNFRLALLASNAALVAQSHPLVGFGLGTVSDVRKINDGSSPLLKTHAGQVALRRSFFYDGNWSLLIVEVGFLGIAAVGLLFASLARLGRWLSETHWIGTALLANVVVTFWLGFFAPIMQARVPSLVLWLSAGLAIALARGRWNPKDERARVPAAQGAGSSAWIAAPELSTKLAPSPVSVGVMRKSSW